jgi:hypothetical protein
MYLGPNGTWLLGCPKGQVPYFAYTDGAAFDVVGSGRLLGLSCAGDYVLQTGYFTTGVYANGTPLVADPVTPGNVTAGAGYYGLANQGFQEEIGFASFDETLTVAGPAGSSVLNLIGYDSEVAPINGAILVLNLTTRWRPASNTQITS